MSPTLNGIAIADASDDDVKISTSVVVMTQCLKEISMPAPSSNNRVLGGEVNLMQQNTKTSIQITISDVDCLEESNLKARKEEMRISLENKKTLLENKKKALELARNLPAQQGDESCSRSGREQFKLKPISALLDTGGLDCIQLSGSRKNPHNMQSVNDDKVRFTNISVLLPVDFVYCEDESECENDDYADKRIHTSANTTLSFPIDEHWSDELKSYYGAVGVYGNEPQVCWRYDQNHKQLPTYSDYGSWHLKGNVTYANGYTERSHNRQHGSRGTGLESQTRKNFYFPHDSRHPNRFLEQQPPNRRDQQLQFTNHQSLHEIKAEKNIRQQKPATGNFRELATDRQCTHCNGDDSSRNQTATWNCRNNLPRNATSDNSKGKDVQNMQQQSQQRDQSQEIQQRTQQRPQWHQHQSTKQNHPHGKWRRNNPNNGRNNNTLNRNEITVSHARCQSQPENRRGKRSKPDDT